MKIDILGCKVHDVNMSLAITAIAKFIEERIPRHVITLNAEIIYRSLTEPPLKELINDADLVTPDGAGVVWAANHLGTPLKERVTGIDILQELARLAPQKNWKLYFYGGGEGIAELAKINLEKRYPGIKIVGARHGYLSPEELKEMFIEIKEKKPDILLIALGAPRQEYWIAENKEHLGVPVSIGVGGSFDVIAGKVKRAPKIMRSLKLEWLYRLMKEPWRYKRMLALPKFMLKVIKDQGSGTRD